LVYRICDDVGTSELWLNLTTLVASVQKREEGLVGFTVSPDGTRAYTHMITWINPNYTNPGFSFPVGVSCNRTHFFPSVDAWKTLPMQGIYNVTEWKLSGPTDAPSNPFTLLRYNVYQLSHAGVDTLRMLGNNNELLIAIGDSSEVIDAGRYASPEQIYAHTWLMNLRRRKNTGPMTTAPRAIADIPQLVQNSLTPVFKQLRNGAAPTFDLDVYSNGDPLLIQWMMGHNSGESVYALRGTDGTSRFSGWPCYMGLGWSTVEVPQTCVAPTSFARSESDEHETTTAVEGDDGLLHHGLFSRVPAEITDGSTFRPLTLSFNVYANMYRRYEGRYLPFGFGAGRVGATTGPIDPQTGGQNGFIGSATIRVNPDECPVALTGAFQSLWVSNSGVVNTRDPIVLANSNISVGVPHLSLWMPDYTRPERQVTTYDYSTDPVFAQSYGGPGRLAMSAMSSTSDNTEILLSHYRIPDAGSGMTNTAETWIITVHD
jgi:hypothetical protein